MTLSFIGVKINWETKMNKTRKTFMLTGAILSIVEAGVLILVGLILFGASNMVTTGMVSEIIASDPTIGEVAEEELQAMVQLIQMMFNVMAFYVVALAIATIPVAIKVMKNTGNNNKGAIIALLVLSIFTANNITFAFMIVALCLKNKPVEVVEAPEETVVVTNE